MKTLHPTTTTYDFDLATIKQMLADLIGESVDRIDVRYAIEYGYYDPRDGTSGDPKLTGIKVVVKR